MSKRLVAIFDVSGWSQEEIDGLASEVTCQADPSQHHHATTVVTRLEDAARPELRQDLLVPLDIAREHTGILVRKGGEYDQRGRDNVGQIARDAIKEVRDELFRFYREAERWTI